MLSNMEFIKQSLEINLFFLRILKEHSIFLKASLPPKGANYSEEADQLINMFSNLLIETINLSYGVITLSKDIVTKYTYEAERATSFMTGLPINSDLTKMELSLEGDEMYPGYNPMLMQYVYSLNQKAINAGNIIINYKSRILNDVLSCSLYSTNYPLLIEHIRREAKYYVDALVKLQKREDEDVIKSLIREESFWNNIMAEHSKFIRGYLDPSEEDLFKIANNFGNEFDELTKKAMEVTERTSRLPVVTRESYRATENIRDFKETATKGLLKCEIKSIIVPLLADHVLREANHYLILIKKYSEEF